MGSRRISRRRLGQLLAAAWPGLPRPGWAQSSDQGIGGTGVVGDPKDEPSDQMIGGTGVIGTVRRFGSIYVNGLRIAYAPTLPVSVDGRSVGAARLRLGQVVRVATVPGPGPLTARSIAVEHEVVGPVEAVGPDRVTVLGQIVLIHRGASSPTITVGQVVAVSGLRRLDGAIVASLVEPAAGRSFSVAGPLRRGAGDALVIGALPLVGLDPHLAGQRVHADGHLTGATFQTTHVVTEQADLARMNTSRFSIEGYVDRERSGLRLGSGLQVGSDAPAVATNGPAVVIVRLDEHHRLVAERVESETAPASGKTPDTDRTTRTKDEKGEEGRSDRGSGNAGGSRGRR